MKLKKFSIRGFRSLKDISWEPGDLNVLIGPNGSGKSNLLRALELLQEAGTADLDGAVVRQGGIGALLWDGLAKGIEWEVDVDPGPELLGFPWLVTDIRYELYLLNEMLTSYRVEREILADRTKAQKDGGPGSLCFQRGPNDASLFNDVGEKVRELNGRLEKTQTVLSQTSRLLSTPLVFSCREYLKSWKIYQDFPVRQDSLVRKSAITRKENHLSPTGDNLISTLHTIYSIDRDFRVQLIDAMRAAFGKDFEELEFPPAEDQHIQMRVRWKSLKRAQSAADLSEGTLKFLMLITILANPSRGDLVAIDEPETYLHPSMFPIIAELASEASKTSQIIFTTHSPEFLTALGVHDPQTAVLQNVDGETKLNVLDQQEMRRWLEKYKLGELFVSGDLEALVRSSYCL